jgi:hypothetical protein
MTRDEGFLGQMETSIFLARVTFETLPVATAAGSSSSNVSMLCRRVGVRSAIPLRSASIVLARAMPTGRQTRLKPSAIACH